MSELEGFSVEVEDGAIVATLTIAPAAEADVVINFQEQP